MDSPFTLHGKVALITGAASGIGLETVRKFLQAKIKGLLLVDVSADKLRSVLQTLTKEERERCGHVVSDVAMEESTYARAAVETWGRLDIAVLNAGICFPAAGILDTTTDVWDKTMNVNARGVFLGLQSCAKVMLDAPSPSGSIILVSSQLGLQGSPGLSAYSASKWAVRGLALTAAEEFTPRGIRVNSVCPGPIETPLIDVFGKDAVPKMAAATLMNRLGQPAEIANAILYLASDASSFCSGTTLKVDGGYAKFG